MHLRPLGPLRLPGLMLDSASQDRARSASPGWRRARPGTGPGRGRLLAVKILHVIGDLAPVSGGPAKACFEMARAVARRGHRLAIYTTDFGQAHGAVPAGGAPVVRDGVELRHFP